MQITIGLSFYNAEQTLLDCLRSIFAQSEQDWELLLIDDGSTDNSLEMVQSIDDPRVRVVSDGRNLGLATRLNQITELAQGEFVARQDSDDLMHPERLAEQLTFLQENPNLDAMGCPWLAIDEQTEVVGISRMQALDPRRGLVVRRVPMSHCTLLGRREWFRKIPYRTDYWRSEERDFWIRVFLIEKSKVALLPKPREFYRIPEFVPLAKTLDGYRENRRLFREFGPELLGSWQTAVCLCNSYAKSALWRLAAPTPLANWLCSRRKNSIDEQSRLKAQQVVEQIQRQPIPGLADGVQLRNAKAEAA